MPSTRSRGEDLVLPIPEPERSITLRRRVQEYRTKYNLPDSNTPTPVRIPT